MKQDLIRDVLALLDEIEWKGPSIDMVVGQAPPEMGIESIEVLVTDSDGSCLLCDAPYEIGAGTQHDPACSLYSLRIRLKDALREASP